MATSSNGTAYSLTGPRDAPVVVLLHGLGLTRESTWAPVARLLGARYRVLSYDLAGHGDSALPEAAVTLTLVGFSLGGMINRRVALDHPDRVWALAILNSPHRRGAAQQELVEARARDTAGGGPGATLEATLERWFTPEYRRINKVLVDEVRAVVLANDHDSYARHRQVLAHGVKELIRPDPPITQPTLVITCENDSGSTPEMSHAIGREIAGAEVVILPGLRHLGLVERPGLFAERIEEFLDRASARADNRTGQAT